MKRMMPLLMACGLAVAMQAATVTIGSATPDVGVGVQNLNFSTNDATNTDVKFVPSDYVAGDNTAALGQTFTTGSDARGYLLTAISVRQVSWGPTYWDYTGGTVTLQIFRLDNQRGNGVSDITQLALETAAVGGEDDGITFSSGIPGTNAMWLTVTLDSPVNLAANTLYGFQIMSDGTGSNDKFFMQIDGTSTNSYANGFALGTGKVNGLPDPALVWDGNNGQPSDRAFVATMAMPPISYLSPANGADLIPVDRTDSENDLVFTINNPNIVEVDVYLEATDPNADVLIDTLTSVTPGQYTVDLESQLVTDLQYETTYYWKLIGYEPNELGGLISVPGPVWSFTTASEMPLITINPPFYTAVDAGESSIVLSANGINGDFQWYKDGIPIADAAGVFAGAMTNTLTIYDVQLADEGYYTLKVSNLVGEDESTPARVMIHRQTSYWPLDTDQRVFDGKEIQLDTEDGYNMVLLSGDDGPDLPSLDPSVVSSLVGDESLRFKNDNPGDPNNGFAQYALVDPGVAEFDDITISCWVYWEGGDSWQRIIDFGNGENEYMFLSPNAAGTYLRFAITNSGASSEQLVQTGLLPIGEWTHVAVTLGGNTARIYVNGELEATNAAFTLNPVQVNMSVNYIADSQYTADPYFNGLIDDLKIYNYARTTEQIGQDYLAGTGGAYVCNLEVYDFEAYDTNGNCLVDLPDFASFATKWLEDDRIYPAP